MTLGEDRGLSSSWDCRQGMETRSIDNNKSKPVQVSATGQARWGAFTHVALHNSQTYYSSFTPAMT